MGWFDWMLRPFRGTPTPEPEPAPPRAEQAQGARAERPRAERPRVERPPAEAKPRGEKKKKARKKDGGLARPAPAAAPAVEVLSVEEAERRYGEA
ncbi:MAG: hypothetical protein ABMA64_36445, partial [Myxococcota bacterium]